MSPAAKNFFTLVYVLSPLAIALILIPRAYFKVLLVSIVSGEWGPMIAIDAGILAALSLGCFLAWSILRRK